MKAMILAAGLANRLRPITAELPKALVPVNGRPLIEYTLLLLKKHKIENIIINLHHQGQKIMDALQSGSKWGVRISYSHEPEILGTGGGLKKVQSYLTDGPFILINGDILTDVNLQEVVAFHHRNKAVSTLVLRQDEDADAWGAVELDSNDSVRSIRGKPQSPDSGLKKRMFTGIHVLDPRIFTYLPPEGHFNIMDAYVQMLQRQETIKGFTMVGYWRDIGTRDRYKHVQEELKRGHVRFSYLTDSDPAKSS